MYSSAFFSLEEGSMDDGQKNLCNPLYIGRFNVVDRVERVPLKQYDAVQNGGGGR